MSAATWHNRAGRTVHTQIQPPATPPPPTFTKRFLLNPSMTRKGEQWLTCVLERLWMVCGLPERPCSSTHWETQPYSHMYAGTEDAPPLINHADVLTGTCDLHSLRSSDRCDEWPPTFSVEQIPDCCNSRWLEFTDFVWHCSYKKLLRMGCELQYTYRIFKQFCTTWIA